MTARHVRSSIMRRFLAMRLQVASSAAIGAALYRVPPEVAGQDAGRIATMARRISQCAAGTTLKLETPRGDATRVIFKNRNGCHSTLCSSCQRFRSRQKVSRYRAIAGGLMQREPHTRFALLTLTSRNQPIEQVADMLAQHEAALDRLFRAKDVKVAVAGHVTGIEIALRNHQGAWQAGVHSHSIIAVHAGYFDRSKNIYLAQPRWVALWQRALRVAYKPICHVKAIPDADGVLASLSECLKYAIAPHRLFERADGYISVDPVVAGHLARALYKRRLVRVGGVFLPARRPPGHSEHTS